MYAIGRREFFKVGLVAAVLGSLGGLPVIFRRPASVAMLDFLSLSMEEVLVEMVDLTPVNMWVFASQEHGPRFPGPVILTQEGRTVEIQVANHLDEPHAFAVPGVKGSGVIEPGQAVRVTFPAPAAGTYIYLDPLNAPVNRVMGLHGVLVVMPPPGASTPFSAPTPAVQRLFDDLGNAPHFPGDPWVPERTWIWVFHTVDPVKNRLAAEAPPGQTIDPRAFTDGYLPQYFTLSGKTGFFSSHDPDIFPHGNIGQPALLRVVNTGMATHSPHIHGNHVYELSEDARVKDNVLLLDTWTMKPLGRKDILHPFEEPPDNVVWPPSNIREFPMPWPMHCHTEMSQTAAGGNYPQGLLTDWEITSPRVGGPEASEEELPFFRGMDPALFA